MVEAWSKAIGKPVKFIPCTMEAYAGLGFPGDAMLAEMFTVCAMDFVSAQDLAIAARLHPNGKFATVAEFFEKNKEKVMY